MRGRTFDQCRQGHLCAVRTEEVLFFPGKLLIWLPFIVPRQIGIHFLFRVATKLTCEVCVLTLVEGPIMMPDEREKRLGAISESFPSSMAALTPRKLRFNDHRCLLPCSCTNQLFSDRNYSVALSVCYRLL